MKDIIIVTGGAGFIGSNLIQALINKTKFKIISIDNYSSGSSKNHIKNKRVIYLKANTKNIAKSLKNKKKKIKAIFHFGEFSRIFQSFKQFSKCIETNSNASFEVFKFCLENKIKLIYSATSASLGNNGNDKNLSPYAFSKAKNLELLENLKKWFGLKFEVVYFYNVYGPKQIRKGSMASVIGIFEYHYLKGLPLPVVSPGTQTRRFTHIEDTVDVCLEAWKKNKCSHYIITNKESYSILKVAKFFNSKIKKLPFRDGERFSSAIIKSKKMIFRFGKYSLKDYIINFVSKNPK
tara:strand:+ start:3032 stop:3910 length:879 start_codon:yes stop_codon:yes gene_type:complete